MANIYLRLSNYVAAFMRSVGDGDSLPKSSPVFFSPYSDEYPVIVNGLRIVPEANQHYAACYSQSAWQNMMAGRLPSGGTPILKRNPKEWLTYAEICTLERHTNRTRCDAYDFLCIALPSEVYVNGRVVRLNKAYTLDTSSAQQLRKMLKQTFIREYLRFEKKNRIFAEGHDFTRANYEILERFFMEHNIPVSHDTHERKSLKRQILRWKDEGLRMLNDPRLMDDLAVSRLDPSERKQIMSKTKGD